MFTVALFAIFERLKITQISIGRWVNTAWYKQTREHYSALKKEEIPLHATTWSYISFI